MDKLLMLLFLVFISCLPTKKVEKEKKIPSIVMKLSTNGNNVAFDQSAIQIPANQRFILRFQNQAEHDSEISHNVAIVRKGMEKEVMEIINKEDYDYTETINFFKNKSYFLGVTKILMPQHEGAIEVPPLEPGFYTYICLMPGHGNILNMKGILFARESLPTEEGGAKDALLEELKEEFARGNRIPYPEDNPFTEAKYNLGKKLFFDPILSKTQKMSCATCHIPEKFFEDGLVTSQGVMGASLSRTTPTIINLAWGELFFWDGRADSLEQQAVVPIAEAKEMALGVDLMLERLNSDDYYIKQFKKVFNKVPSKNLVGKAIATFERSIISKKSPFDLWVEGDEKAISQEAIAGFKIFNGKANCVTCHSSWRFTDDSFHDIGIKTQDIGRGKFLKEIKSMQFAFKTPTLRNIAKTSPYMHDGSFKSLDEVIEFYNRGGDVSRKSLAQDIKPLHLDQIEIKYLKSFLNTLTSEVSMEGL